MLVLTRKQGETVHAGPVAITVTRIDGNRVRLGIDAPQIFPIVRGELLPEQQPGDGMTFGQIVHAAVQPGVENDKETLYALLAAAISLLADAEEFR